MLWPGISNIPFMMRMLFLDSQKFKKILIPQPLKFRYRNTIAKLPSYSFGMHQQVLFLMTVRKLKVSYCKFVFIHYNYYTPFTPRLCVNRNLRRRALTRYLIHDKFSRPEVGSFPLRRITRRFFP